MFFRNLIAWWGVSRSGADDALLRAAVCKLPPVGTSMSADERKRMLELFAMCIDVNYPPKTTP